MRFAAVVPAYNRQDFIGSYLEMMLSNGVDCFINLSNVPWDRGGNQESVEPDKTERLLSRYFPDVPVNKKSFRSHKESLSYNNDILKKYDRIFVMDCDMLLTEDDFYDLEEFLEKDYDVFRVNFETMIQEYYYDYRFGKPAIPGGLPPIIAIRSGIKMENMIMADSQNEIVWDNNHNKIHHFRFSKSNGSGKHLYSEPKTNLEDYKHAPQEIIDSLLKWKELLKTL